MHKHTNKLIHETSPYLLQHAHNPVQWYPWGTEALEKAKEENKPILVSIGYSACHWCHVMERESFENEATAALMNQYFINIKIDREERPDLDHIYMDAVQAISGSGGWPLNVFLTPDARPFYGGTYFPPTAAYNRPSWTDTLLGVAQAFRERKHEIDAQAENLTSHLQQANSFGLQKIAGDEIFRTEKIDLAVTNLLKTADMEWGGFGRAPKFPQTQSILFLLRHAYVNNTLVKKEETNLHDKKSLLFGGGEAALLSLNKMIDGGIYDQIGGGFARYATDTEWLIPHFEKMLYDNALLIGVLAEAHQATGALRYKEVIEETMNFITSELQSPDGGFYAALDADSEGVEGKYYVWTKEETATLLGNDADLFNAFYDITEKGNWEGHSIPRVKETLSNFAKANNLEEQALKKMLHKSRETLLLHREKRVHPGLDDKIILSWNALMNTACSKAFAATQNEAYRQMAIQNMKFLLSRFKNTEVFFYHTYKNGQAKYPAFLDDYAYLAEALLNLYTITANNEWLLMAKKIVKHVQVHFRELDTPFFYYTSQHQTDVIVRKKEVYDGATPSGNAVMAANLWKLSHYFSINEWRQQAMDMLAALGSAVTRYPSSFGQWACLLQEVVLGTNEVVVTGPNFEEMYTEIAAAYLPHSILAGCKNPQNELPITAGKLSAHKSAIFLCRNNTCLPPVFFTSELISLINKG
ncbi:MAG: hypothetical protein RIR12_1461 [Bacteroidota bacterium]|jgi:uncharacterized protein YyaL (SSP411 family)